MISQTVIRKAFKTSAISARLLSDSDRCSAKLISRGVKSLGSKQENAERSLNHILRVSYTVNKIILLIYKSGGKLGGIYVTVAHLKEMSVILKDLVHYLIRIVYSSYGTYGERTVT